MKPVKLGFAVALALAAMPLAAFAQDAVEEEASAPWSFSLTATSDYVFRGVSQTGGGPAFQADATYTTPFGLYAGVWGSNVDFGGGGPNFEFDYSIGWNKDLGDNWNLDLGAIRYAYAGADRGYGNIDYNEYIGKLTWSGPVTIDGTLAYANDYSNTGAGQTYAALGISYDIGETGFALGATAGYTSIGDSGDGRVSYGDYSVSISKSFGPATATLGYYDTAGSDAGELRKTDRDYYQPGLVLTISVAVP
jgi:uncharacterized protein (TIGR02001 family)